MNNQVNIPIVKSALHEISDIEYQLRVWVQGSESEISSMDEAVAALFDDSGLDFYLQRGQTVFSNEIDGKLRNLQKLLSSSLTQQRKLGVAEEVASERWREIRSFALEILESIKTAKKN